MTRNLILLVTLLALAALLPTSQALTLGAILVGIRVVSFGLGRGTKRVVGLMRYAYDGWLIALAVVTLIFVAKDVAVIVVMLTFGLGIPLLFASTALAYGLCARPAVVAWINGGPPLGYAIGGAAVVALAVLPNLIGALQAHRVGQSLRASDHEPAQPVAIRSLEFRRPAADYDGTFAADGPCGGNSPTI